MDIINFPQLADAHMALTKEKHENPDTFRGYRTSFPVFDNLLGGFHDSWYIVIGGPEKSGKSALATSLMMNFARDGVSTMFISLEMDNTQMASRVYSNASGVPLNKFRDVQLDDDDWDRVYETHEALQGYEGHFAYGVFDVETAIQIAVKHQPKVVIIDYAQLMNSLEKTNQRHEELAVISRKMKMLALGGFLEGYTPVVITLAQLNQEAAKAKNFNTSYGFHGSAAFKNDCDLAMVIAPYFDGEDEINELRNIHIVASRHSDKFTFTAAFRGERSLMAQVANEEWLAKMDNRPKINLQKKVDEYMAEKVPTGKEEDDMIQKAMSLIT
jgi:replicative DNA helicase